MGFLSRNSFENLKDLLVDQVEDLYDAEVRLTEALPKMSDAANSGELKQAIQQHLGETRGHVDRLKRVFQIMGMQPERETCEGMKGLIKEGEEMIDATGDDAVCDAALIAAAQRVEHYEMAGYGTARTLAQQLGLQDVARLLQSTLNEEKAADKKLTDLAEHSVNVQAAGTR